MSVGKLQLSARYFSNPRRHYVDSLWTNCWTRWRHQKFYSRFATFSQGTGNLLAGHSAPITVLQSFGSQHWGLLEYRAGSPVPI